LESVYIYIRWSSQKQDKGDSKERQTAACVGHAERKGWTLAEPVFGDFGVSAWQGDHVKTGALGRFADRVRSGEITPGSILLVEALDRLSREEWRDARNWLEEMTDLGLRIATVEGDRVYDSEKMRKDGIIDSLEIMLKTKAANDYSERLSERLTSSWKKRRKAAAEGIVISKHVPGWLAVEGTGADRKFRTIPERVTVVQEIYRLAAEGVGARSIARTLNERGFKPWGRDHHHANSTAVGWEHTYIADLLKTSSVEGDYEPRIGRRRNAEKTGERILGYFGAAIVDADLVARARAAVVSRKGRGGRGRDQCRNLFTGVIRCGSCGGAMVMVGNSSRPDRYLQCNIARSGRGCDRKAYVRYSPFEAAAMGVILPFALDNRFFERPDATGSLAIQLAEVQKAIELKRADESRLVDLLMRTESEAVEVRLKSTEAERKDLLAERDRIEIELKKARGAVSPAEHMKRVLEVRTALNDPDYESRLAARRKVAQAIVDMGFEAVADLDKSTGEIRTMLRLPVAGLTYFFDNTGAVVSGIAPDRPIEFADIDLINKSRRDDYLRRRADNPPPAQPLDGMAWTSDGEEPKITADDVARFHGIDAS